MSDLPLGFQNWLKASYPNQNFVSVNDFFSQEINNSNMQSQTINILQKPTFDLTEIEILNSAPEDKIVFIQSTQVFKFDKCKGLILPRSRVLRQGTDQSKLIKNVVFAVIDSGFCGKLCWKIELTEEGAIMAKKVVRSCITNREELFEYFLDIIQNSVQLSLDPFPNNYYDGTNQTTENPDIIFTSITN